MKIRYWLSGIAGALALGVFTLSAQAAPAGGPAAGLKAAAGEASIKEDVHWRRRCWRHRGHWHCRRHWVGYYPYGYPYYYGYYPYYGPGIRFYFGGGRHHYHRRHGGWRHHRWR